MNSARLPQRYSTLSIAFHWLMLLLIIAVYALMELRDIYPKGSAPQDAMKMWHFMLGLSVFGLVWLRIMARLFTNSPAPMNEPNWRKLAAKATHLALYALMIAMPIGGWLILSGEGKPIPFFGLELPALIGPNKDVAETVEELHKLGATIGYWLIGLHTLAALFHQYVLKDRLMSRMLPARS